VPEGVALPQRVDVVKRLELAEQLGLQGGAAGGGVPDESSYALEAVDAASRVEGRPREVGRGRGQVGPQRVDATLLRVATQLTGRHTAGGVAIQEYRVRGLQRSVQLRWGRILVHVVSIAGNLRLRVCRLYGAECAVEGADSEVRGQAATLLPPLAGADLGSRSRGVSILV